MLRFHYGNWHCTYCPPLCSLASSGAVKADHWALLCKLHLAASLCWERQRPQVLSVSVFEPGNHQTAMLAVFLGTGFVCQSASRGPQHREEEVGSCLFTAATFLQANVCSNIICTCTRVCTVETGTDFLSANSVYLRVQLDREITFNFGRGETSTTKWRKS